MPLFNEEERFALVEVGRRASTQPAAVLVGPSSEPSVLKMEARFSSGVTICIEKTIKEPVPFGCIQRVDEVAGFFMARSAPTLDVTALHSKKSSDQRDKECKKRNGGNFGNGHPPKFRSELQIFGVFLRRTSAHSTYLPSARVSSCVIRVLWAQSAEF
jgi:hypothetical protein